MAFAAHVVVTGRCTKVWRGANFDAANAEAAVGAAVAGALGLRVRTTPELESFLKRVFVRSYAVGDLHEFHVGLRDPADAARVDEIERLAAAAVASSRHFVHVP